jgi:substrate-binding family protein
MIDDRAAARTATEYLLERGHRKIGLINGLLTSLTARLREEGYRTALRAVGIQPSANRSTRLGYHVTSAAPAVDRVMSRRDPPSALVVANVNAALGVLTHARHLGCQVPEELSVIGIQDAWTADHTWPPLTTVRMPLYDLGIRGSGGAQRSSVRFRREGPHRLHSATAGDRTRVGHLGDVATVPCGPCHRVKDGSRPDVRPVSSEQHGFGPSRRTRLDAPSAAPPQARPTRATT